VGVYEYNGLDSASPVDKTTGGTGAGTSANGGTLTTTINNELYFAVGSDTTGHAPTPGSGYTLENNNTATGSQSIYTEDKVAPQGSYATNFTSNNGFWAVIGASFKPGIIGTPTPTPTAGPTPTPTTAPTPTPTSIPTPTPTPGASGPDLVITNLSAPANGTKNNIFTISTTVKNQGTTGLSNIWLTVGYYYDKSQAPTFTTTPSDSNQFFVSSLAAGASTTLNYVFGQFSTSGNHTIYALVNQDKAVTESNYNNNVAGPNSITIAYAGPFNSFLARIGLNDLADILAVQHADAQVAPQPTNSMQYTYDALGRLNYASYSASLQYNYAYDSVGNRSALISGPYKTTYTYDADNQYNSNSYYLNSGGNWFTMNSGSRIFNTYDKNGSLTNRGVGSASTSVLTNAAISYDFDNHMTKFINSSNQPATYVYDGNGTRIARTTQQGTQHFAVDTTGDLDRLLVQADANNNVTDEIDYGVGPISEGSSTNAASRFYMLEDGTSNTRLYTDYGGSLVEYYMYDPYGTVIYQGPSNLNINITNNGAGSTNTVNYTGPIAGNYDGIYKFQTQELDNPSQLYFLRARYYDPSIGRFVTRDPLQGTTGNPLTQNPYIYSGDNPINLSDPSGEQWYVDMAEEYGTPLLQKVVNFCSNFFSSPEGQEEEGAVLKGTQNPSVRQAIQEGLKQHEDFYQTMQEKGMTTNKAIFKQWGDYTRPDAVDYNTKTIYELKPQNTPVGQRQLQEYVDKANQYLVPGWKGVLQTYKE